MQTVDYGFEDLAQMVSVLAERLFESLYFGKAGPVYCDCFVLFNLVSLNTGKHLSTVTKTYITKTHGN